VKPPESVVVGPYVYRLTMDAGEWDELMARLREEHWGYTDHAAAVIYVQPEIAPSLERTIVLHEILHAVAFAAGTLFDGKRREEEWVLRTAPGLLDTLRRTPGLVEYLREV
jgi:hypothetical protein